MKLRIPSLVFLAVSAFCLLLGIPAIAGITKGVVRVHPADGTIIYNWFSYIPNSASKSAESFIVVSVTGGLTDYSENTEQIRLYTENIKNLAETYQLILLTPSVPRIDNPNIYTIAFDRHCFSDTTDPMYRRPDLKINLMIDNLIDELKNDGYVVNERVFFEGFSAGGMFAQRYALIHPERVQAIAAGQCGGSLTLPIRKYDQTSLTWAIGISDFTTLLRANFNNFIYRQIPQFIYIGENDINNSHFQWPNPDGFWSQDQIDFINSIFGDTDPIRLESMANFMDSIGCNITFKMYANTGHEIMPWNTPQIYADIYSFLVQQKGFIFRTYNPNLSIYNILLE